MNKLRDVVEAFKRKTNANELGRRSPSARQVDRYTLRKLEGGVLGWTGVSPCIPYCQYWFAVSKEFHRIYENSSHELYVGRYLVAAERRRVNDPLKTGLCRIQADFRIPGEESDYVAQMMLARLIHYFLKLKNPKDQPGVYHLLKDGQESKSRWHLVIRLYRKAWFRYNCKNLGISGAAFEIDPEAYLNLGKVRRRADGSIFPGFNEYHEGLDFLLDDEDPT